MNKINFCAQGIYNIARNVKKKTLQWLYLGVSWLKEQNNITIQ